MRYFPSPHILHILIEFLSTNENDGATDSGGSSVNSFPDYVVKLCHQSFKCDSEHEAFQSKLSEYGYNIAATDTHAILLKYGN